MSANIKSMASFLLKHPPIEEIGGEISNIVEEHRFGMLTEQESISKLIANFEPLLKKLARQNDEINNDCIQLV